MLKYPSSRSLQFCGCTTLLKFYQNTRYDDKIFATIDVANVVEHAKAAFPTDTRVQCVGTQLMSELNKKIHKQQQRR
jgi:hypothetical protein